MRIGVNVIFLDSQNNQKNLDLLGNEKATRLRVAQFIVANQIIIQLANQPPTRRTLIVPLGWLLTFLTVLLGWL